MRKKTKTIAIWQCQECGALYAKQISCWCCIDMEGVYTGKYSSYQIVKLGEFTANQIKSLRPYRK